MLFTYIDCCLHLYIIIMLLPTLEVSAASVRYYTRAAGSGGYKFLRVVVLLGRQLIHSFIN